MLVLVSLFQHCILQQRLVNKQFVIDVIALLKLYVAFSSSQQ